MLFMAAKVSAVPCEYSSYNPTSTKFVLERALADRGFAVVPRSVFEGIHLSSIEEEYWIVKDGHKFGRITKLEDLAVGFSTLQILDNYNAVVASSTESVESCHGGLCRTTSMKVLVGAETSTLNVFYRPEFHVTYFVNLASYNRLRWQSEVNEHLSWAIDNVTGSGLSYLIPTTTDRDRLFVLLASDPQIAPFLSMFSVSADAGGRITVKGRTNHETYNLIVSKSIEAGLFNIDFKVVIDSGIRNDIRVPSDLCW